MLFDDIDPDDEFFEADDVEISAGGEKDLLAARETVTLIGHRAIEQKLLQMIANGRFPQGLIFSGPEGIGKSVMAFRLARFLFAEKDREPDMFGAPAAPESLFIDKTHPLFAKVQSGGHPDLLTIGRPIDDTGRVKASVPVDEIRKIAPFMRRTASVEGGWRIVIVDDADTMTRSSQNSLLKILEEPPEKSLLILITHRAGALLPTVYSRCAHIPFQTLAESEIRTALSGQGLAAGDADLIAAMAEGSLGRARKYASGDHPALIRSALAFLDGWPAMNWADIQDFAETFGTKGNDDAQAIFCETLSFVSSALVRDKHWAVIPALARLSDMLGMPARLRLHDRLREHIGLCLGGNLDRRFLILGAYMAFERDYSHFS